VPPQLGGDLGTLEPGVAAGLQVGPEVVEPERSRAFLHAPIAAVVDHKRARKDVNGG
jgi:hypothetical protein